MAEEEARARYLEPGRPFFQRAAKAAIADENQTGVWVLASDRGERFDQQIEALLTLEPPHRTEDEVVVFQSEVAAHGQPAIGKAAKDRRVNRVQHDLDTIGRGATAHQLTLDVGRHGDDTREAREQALVERIVDEPLARRIPAPAVHGRQRNDAG